MQAPFWINGAQELWALKAKRCVALALQDCWRDEVPVLGNSTHQLPHQQSNIFSQLHFQAPFQKGLTLAPTSHCLSRTGVNICKQLPHSSYTEECNCSYLKCKYVFVAQHRKQMKENTRHLLAPLGSLSGFIQESAGCQLPDTVIIAAATHGNQNQGIKCMGAKMNSSGASKKLPCKSWKHQTFPED